MNHEKLQHEYNQWLAKVRRAKAVGLNYRFVQDGDGQGQWVDMLEGDAPAERVFPERALK